MRRIVRFSLVVLLVLSVCVYLNRRRRVREWARAARTGSATVTELKYTDEVVDRELKRTFGLLRAGVRRMSEATHRRSWQNAFGYAFIERVPEGPERGAKQVRLTRGGWPCPGRPEGVRRDSYGQLQVEPGYVVVDVFSSIGRYVSSVVVREEVLDTDILLEGLGILKPLAQGVHKVNLTVEEKVDWRSKFPLFDEEGYGPIFAYVYADEDGNDPTRDVAKQKYGFEKYDRVEEGGYTLFVRWKGPTGVVHVFLPGGEYAASFQIVPGEAEPTDVLGFLGLRAPSGDG